MILRAALACSHDVPEYFTNMYLDEGTENFQLNIWHNTLGTQALGKPSVSAEEERFMKEMERANRKGIQTPAIMALGDPDSRMIELDETQMVCGDEPFVGMTVKIKRMRKTPEFNNLNAELTEDLGDGKFMAKLDDEEVEELIARGYIKPDDDTKEAPEEAAGGFTAKMMEGEDYAIAGNWDEFRTHSMKFDSVLQCFKYYLQLKQGASGAVFSVARGQAGGKKLKTRGKSWTILSDGEGAVNYEVRLFLKDLGTIRKVEWAQIPNVPNEYLSFTSTIVAE